MKKINILFALCFVAQVIFAASVTPASGIPDYWSSVNGKSGTELWKAVNSATNKGYSSIGYKNLYSAYLKTDVYPSDSIGKAGKIWDMYGECAFSSSNTCGNYSSPCDCYNREHSIPQSWWGGGTSGIGNDIFHVLPTDGKINGVRSNYEYGEVNGGTNWLGNKYGSAGSWSTSKKTIATAAGESVNGSGNVFEPKKQYKGDWARGIMGTIVKWQEDLTQDNNFFSGTYTPSQYFGLTKKAVVLLMKWHREDPVSQKEIDRNNGIQQTQGNRNPFIDYPYLAEYIWGEHAGEEIDMSKLMPSTDPDFIPGESDGWRGGSGPTPPTPSTPKFGVNWYVNGTLLKTDSIEQNKKVQSLPASPSSCSSESNIFVGWTNAPIAGETDVEPAVLYTAADQIPALTADITLHAVFAKQEEGGAAPATYIFDADHQEGWTNTATSKGSYWLLETGKTIVSPVIDLMGLSSITVKMRTYGGTQYDELTISEASGVLATLEATKGSTMSEYTWENNLYIAGNSALTFSSNYGSNKGIGVQSIVINATGSGKVYTRFITSCQDPTEVELVSEEGVARKVLVGGHVYILVGEQLFTITGQRVK